MVNSQTFDPDKYAEYKGSPYLWKENKEVIIYDRNAVDYNSVMGNYNGLDHEFEVYENNQFIRLPHETYISIEVINDPKVKYTLYSNVHSKLKNKYSILHGRGDNYRVYESFDPQTSEVVIETPGKTTRVNKIKAKSYYYIAYGADLIQFEPKKKKLVKQFGHKKAINKFLKENKIKIKNVADVIPLFDFLDANGWLK